MEAAKQADVVVLALGESSEMSGEAGSRAHLDLPGNQEKLLEAVTATGKSGCAAGFFGPAAGADMGSTAYSRDYGNMVPGNGGGVGDCRFAVW